jgi:fructose-1,6-bisphosphatase/inositol monophosphatase family enzyme
MTPTSAVDALGIAKQLARAAGDMALAGRKAGLHNVQTKSTGTDMVTEFDRRQHRPTCRSCLHSGA